MRISRSDPYMQEGSLYSDWGLTSANTKGVATVVVALAVAMVMIVGYVIISDQLVQARRIRESASFSDNSVVAVNAAYGAPDRPEPTEISPLAPMALYGLDGTPLQSTSFIHCDGEVESRGHLHLDVQPICDTPNNLGAQPEIRIVFATPELAHNFGSLCYVEVANNGGGTGYLSRSTPDRGWPMSAAVQTSNYANEVLVKLVEAKPGKTYMLLDYWQPDHTGYIVR